MNREQAISLLKAHRPGCACIRLLMNLSVLFLISARPCHAQFAHWSTPVSTAGEKQLLKQLASDTGIDRIITLTTLANLYTYRPIKAADDTARANRYIKEAEQACGPGYPQTLFNNIQLLKVDMLLGQDRFDLASKWSPRLDDTTRAMVFIALAYSVMSRDDGASAANNRSARAWFDKAAMLIDSVHNPVLYTILEQDYAELLVREGKYVEAENAFNKALDRFQKIHYRRLQYFYLEFVDFCFIRGKYDQALAASLKAVEYSLSTRDSTSAGDAYAYLAVVFRTTGQLEKAIDNLDKAMVYYKAYTGRIGNLYWCIHEAGGMLISKKQFREALTWYLQQYDLNPPETEDARIQSFADIGDAYLKLKDYANAERYFLREFNDKRVAGRLNETTWHRIGFFYIECGRYRQALPYLDSAVNRIDPFTPIQTRGHLYYMHYLADSALHNYASAIHYLRANKEVDETLNDQSKQAEIQRLTVQYETEAKNKQISLLQKTNQLYLANQHNAELIRNISIAAILGIAIVAWVFYVQFRNKKRLAALVNEKNKQLGVLLNEKEWLLKEVHHRVKNNLHTVISLLDIQAEFLQDDALKAIENSQHRIYAMSLIHQKLYADDSLTTINIAAYIGELVGYLRDSFEDGSDLCFQMEIEPINLDIAIAIPLGLIINEAVSNSCKYAFPGRKKGRVITISLYRTTEGIQLECRDNGIGLSSEAFGTRPGSLGLTLIKGLGKEINAEVRIANDNGTRIIAWIPMAQSPSTINQPT